jgi:hypothetical protein
VERNISQFFFEYRKIDEQSFTIIDTLDVTRKPPLFLPTHISRPVLEENMEYFSRVSVRYRNGTIRSSNEVNFVSPEIKGKVTKRLFVPDDPTFYPDRIFSSKQEKPSYYPNIISFDCGYIYAVQYGYLTRMDTASGAIVLLTNQLDRYIKNPDIYEIEDFSVFNNSVYLFDYTYVIGKIELKKLNLQTFEIEKTIEIQTPCNNFRIFHNFGDSVYVLMCVTYDSVQTAVINTQTGEIIETFPPILNQYDWFRNQFTYDGVNFWVSEYMDHQFRFQISQFDPNVGITDDNSNQVPVFDAHGLAWDGSHFWVFEPETRSFVKLELEGI